MNRCHNPLKNCRAARRHYCPHSTREVDDLQEFLECRNLGYSKLYDSTNEVYLYVNENGRLKILNPHRPCQFKFVETLWQPELESNQRARDRLSEDANNLSSYLQNMRVE